MSSAQVSCGSQGGKDPLDATSVHPESYEAAEELLDRLGYDAAELAHGGVREGRKVTGYRKLAEDLGIGEMTLRIS